MSKWSSSNHRQAHCSGRSTVSTTWISAHTPYINQQSLLRQHKSQPTAKISQKLHPLPQAFDNYLKLTLNRLPDYHLKCLLTSLVRESSHTDRQCNPMQVYPEPSHIMFSGAYSQVNVHRDAALHSNHSFILSHLPVLVLILISCLNLTGSSEPDKNRAPNQGLILLQLSPGIHFQ